MVLQILQIGDIHFKDGSDSIFEKIDKMSEAIQSRLSPEDELLVVLTGDLAFSGRPEQYKVTSEFLRRLLAPFDKTGRKLLGKVAVPGNHDCSFPEGSNDRLVLINSIPDYLEQLDASGSIIQQLLTPQSSFFEFERELSGRDALQGSAKMLWTRSFRGDQLSVRVNCFNSSWMSQRKEQPGKLLMPNTLLTSLPAHTDEELIVSVFHHPYGWFEPNNGRQFRRLIENNSDIVLTGHDHAPDVYEKRRANQPVATYVEGGALQAVGLPSEFLMIGIDLETKTQTIIRFGWQRDLYFPTIDYDGPFVRNRFLVSSQFGNSEHFRSELEDPGTGYTHPRKAQLTLSDLYVYPDVRFRNLTSDKVVTIDSDRLATFVSQRKQLLFQGPELCGKTALAKMLYRQLQEDFTFVPLLLYGNALTGSSDKAFENVIKRAYEHQYSPSSFERYRQLSPDRKVLIVDDWHRARMNAAGKSKFIRICLGAP